MATPLGCGLELCFFQVFRNGATPNTVKTFFTSILSVLFYAVCAALVYLNSTKEPEAAPIARLGSYFHFSVHF
nr:hypothetical protein [Tanacetum cinerariifolium]